MIPETVKVAIKIIEDIDFLLPKVKCEILDDDLSRTTPSEYDHTGNFKFRYYEEG